MADLLKSTRLLEVSSHLQLAASSLRSLAQGRSPDRLGQDSLKWAGHFLPQVDWNSKVQPTPGIGGGLAVQATATRPTFYSALIRIAPDFQRAGMTSQKAVFDFLDALYRVLNSGGNSAKSLPSEKLNLGAELLHTLSQTLVAELSNNGLPRQPVRLTTGAMANAF